MRGDGLAFAVGVGGEIDAVCLGGELLEPVYDLFFAGGDDERWAQRCGA